MKKDTIISLIMFLIVIIGILIVFLSWEVWFKPGEISDKYSALQALFSGLAFAAFLYAVYLQKLDLKKTHEELELNREELKLQREEMERQRLEMENQRQEFEVKRITDIIYKQIELINNEIKSSVFQIENIDFKKSLNPQLLFNFLKYDKYNYEKNKRININILEILKLLELSFKSSVFEEDNYVESKQLANFYLPKIFDNTEILDFINKLLHNNKLVISNLLLFNNSSYKIVEKLIKKSGINQKEKSSLYFLFVGNLNFSFRDFTCFIQSFIETEDISEKEGVFEEEYNEISTKIKDFLQINRSFNEKANQFK